MDLHRRLDAELKERHAFLAEKQKSLEDKDSSLSARSQVLEAQSKMLDDKLKQADALKRLQDELENRQITVKYQESKILDLTKELAAKERLLAQKEEALALKETQLADLIARSATMQTSAQSNASLLNAEDDAILFLAEELEKTKRSFKHRAAVKQLGVAPAEDASEDVRHAIHECKVLLSIDKVESAKQKYTEIKKRFEALPAPDRVLYQEIVALYQQIRVAMSHDAL